MPNRRRSKPSTFLDGFEIEELMLLRPDRKAGKPGIYAGFDENGDPVLIKFWPKLANVPDDDDLREIWHHEVRQLHRLGGYPDPEECIAPLSQTGADRQGFYLVLKPGQRRPLAKHLERLPPGSWLANPRLPANRMRLWRNLRRIVNGVEILHTQGLLHRSLDTWSILSSLGDEPDFQLTGFEWSLRLVSATAPKGKSKALPSGAAQPVSFLEDWKAFGRLTAQLLRISESRLTNLSIPASDVSEAVSVEETRLIRNLLHADPLERLDGEVIVGRIDRILEDLAAEVAGREPKLFLVVQLGSGRLAERIAEASDQLAGVGEIDEQKAFIADDLRERCLLMAIRTSDGFRLALQGGKLVYSLDTYNLPRGGGSTWDFAYCSQAEHVPPTGVLGAEEFAPESIELLTPREAAERYQRLRGKLTSWENFRSRFKARRERASRERQFHRALALTLHLEALYSAADVYPVEVLGPTDTVADGSHRLRVRVRDDPDRKSLSDALGLAPPSARLSEVLSDDRRTDEWILTEAIPLGQRDEQETRWRFEDISHRPGRPEIFNFLGAQPAPNLRNAVLIPGDSVGREVQFRRRLKALRALADHDELLRMLTTPRNRVLDSHETVDRDAAFEALDESKQRAFEAIVGTIPLFMVQGPPGVGKTRLARDLVCSWFRADPTGRVLLTAQSNAAVDHLMNELHSGLTNVNQELLVVRCRSRDDTDDAGPFEVRRQAHDILERLLSSQLVGSAPPTLKAEVDTLKCQLTGGAGESRSSRERYAMRAFEGLLVKSANAVFATTNSQELERLIEERGQFDWAIIEESGKATGAELLSPLLLSHRRLMIGDHKQLSPFGSERILRILENPDDVRKALQAGEAFIGATLRDPSTDEVLDDLEDDEADLPVLCAQARGCLLLFEQLIENEFKLQRLRPNSKRIAHRLTLQHRMHPAIARVVSHAFYDDDLKSHEETVTRFTTERCPVRSSDPERLPEKPIVIVDMPWVQDTIGMDRVEDFPRWHNSQERDAVVAVVKLLCVAPSVEKKPSLAILSPYGEQVRRLKGLIDERVDNYPNLKHLRAGIGPGEYCGTVDSFQGNEADVVIVSLVRNNHHGRARSALGFLSDPRRMNVLLSRARWRMVLVGSIKFLEQVLKVAGNNLRSPDLTFLSKFLEALESERSRGEAVLVPINKLMPRSTR